MRDKKLEENIKKAENFMQIWGKSRALFGNMVSGNHVNRRKEEEFLSIKDLLNTRYGDLMDSLGVKPLRRFTLSEALYNVLTLENVFIMSDDKLVEVGRDWAEAQKFLSRLVDRLKRKRKRIKKINRIALSIKRKMARKKKGA